MLSWCVKRFWMTFGTPNDGSLKPSQRICGFS